MRNLLFKALLIASIMAGHAAFAQEVAPPPREATPAPLDDKYLEDFLKKFEGDLLNIQEGGRLDCICGFYAEGNKCEVEVRYVGFDSRLTPPDFIKDKFSTNFGGESVESRNHCLLECDNVFNAAKARWPNGVPKKSCQVRDVL